MIVVQVLSNQNVPMMQQAGEKADSTEVKPTAAQRRMKYLKIGAAAVGGGTLLAVTG